MFTAINTAPIVEIRNDIHVPGPAIKATTGIEISGAPEAPIFAIDCPRTAHGPRLRARNLDE